MAEDISNKVISFQSLKAKKQVHKVAKRAVGAEQVPITDITHKRQQMIAEERRNVRRTILTEFVGAFIIIPQRGLARVSLYDISNTGVSFDIDSNSGQLMIGDEIANALNALPVDFRTVIILCDVEGFTYEEMAKILDIPIGTVRSRLHRARMLLKEKLKSYAKSLGYDVNADTMAE